MIQIQSLCNNMKTKVFQRTVEDFVCEHCGEYVQGNGYTNHCPLCLWSKHVDVHPGDRSASCGGLMDPIRLEGSSPSYTIVHHCVRCNHEKRNTVSDTDDAACVIAIARKLSHVI